MSTAKGDCFQIIGVDVIIDKNLKPWVLEINSKPSLNINGANEEVCELDRHIKSSILY